MESYILLASTRTYATVPRSNPLRKTTVEIDDELIARVRVLLGTSSIKDTIDEALREVERHEARRREIQALIGMEGLDLADEKVMATTWRY
ncbi:MAG: type II toxin-antitoxin system VapB family antitoxin [Gemmatimonadota bacterium]|nr:type II toxin-antitoxin system VapB family antitoxin [Gemmatimonadota bacterium]MDE2677489.1 type II toxin-antitoxin system VapB family antitoxin [Gemmatimonadota bacterium]